jgi:2-polyprenyl-3-methyl-5-hydroxy-6-metoxy-1,4-benzoquinol methylase
MVIQGTEKESDGAWGRGLWNVNIHYDARLAACVPASAAAVLDVGCGDGFLAARLTRCVPNVVAIDIDAPVLGRARARFPDMPVAWCCGDVLAYPLVPGSFDAVLSNAMFHHLPDARAGLRQLSELVRPGGTLAIVGFPHAEWRDLPWAVTTTILRGVAIRVRRKWPHTAPTVWPPRDSIRQLRQAAREVLPGSRVRLLPLGRYLLTWTRPPELAGLGDPGSGRLRARREQVRLAAAESTSLTAR